jgi:hypothetical protein
VGLNGKKKTGIIGHKSANNRKKTGITGHKGANSRKKTGMTGHIGLNNRKIDRHNRTYGPKWQKNGQIWQDIWA